MQTAEKVFSALYSPTCWKKFAVELDFMNAACLTLFLNKSVGYGIIVGSSLVKFPQILKIWFARSAQGISFSSVLLELLAISFGVAYGFSKQFPFSSYGEGVFLAIQTFLVAFFVLWYQGLAARALLFFVLYSCMMTFLCSPMVPLTLVTVLQASNMPIVVTAKGIQAYMNYQNRSTGQLSVLTLLLLFAGSLARIFTSIYETGDQLIVWTYILATFMNGIILFQTYLYQPAAAPLTPKKTE